MFVPDWVRETFRPSTGHGGHDGDGRGLRYMEWDWDPDPTDTTYVADFAYLLRDEDGAVRVERDRHLMGLFSRLDWLRLLDATSFRARIVAAEHGEEIGAELFVGVRPR